jgi:hypothetical protein
VLPLCPIGPSMLRKAPCPRQTGEKQCN